MTSKEARRLLVPVADSVTLRNTVAYAVEEAAAASDGAPATIHFVVFESARAVDPTGPADLGEDRELLDRVSVWADEDRAGQEASVEVELAVVGADRYLFSPDQYADALADYAVAHDVDRVVLDPEYDPGSGAPMLWPLETELQRRDLDVEEAPVERPRRQTVLGRTGTARKYVAIFGASYLFYQALGAWTTFDLVTGGLTAGLVAALLAPIVFGHQPSLTRLAVQTVRLAVYAPYLLWEIAKANLQIAYVVLHPSLPIDPEMVEFDAAVWGDTPVTTLANSITLTPGTLTVDVTEQSFVVHSLTEATRDGLFEGSLERAVRFVFWGRAAARIPSPRERGEEGDDG
ncbi:monovalent cation/H+ antiporter subunit E [Halomicrobium zhouii]|uniref:monovalent cation/H+ antiporter subunit E n=1 Tax=Halomicrobium zhouii TaxID=767519 RepID=UPI000B7E0252|nr:monovalent cation/H+ antiporter subunit E [Halomicrobium zhouii]